MNFEGFQDLMRRIARTWYERAKVEVYNDNFTKTFVKTMIVNVR